RGDNRGEGRGGDDDHSGNNDSRNNDNRGDNRGSDNRGGDNRGGDNRDNRGGRNNNQDDDNGRRGRRGRRNRRSRGGNERGHSNYDMQIREGDELQAGGGILEVVDHNVAFLRTTGYRAMGSDVFVNNNLVRRLGLRSGDAVTGQVKVGGATHSHGNGRNRRKFNQLA